MNIKEYISSGILELYVLGQLDPDEAQEVESMVREHAEVEQELRAIQAAMLAVSEANALPPPLGLEERIMEQLEDAPTPPSETKSGGHTITYMLSGLLLASLFGLFFLFQKSNNQQKELEKIRAEFEELRAECEAVQKSNQQAIAYLDKINADGNSSISMTDQEGNLAVVHWNQQVGKTYLEIKTLNSPPLGKQYQLWAIVDGVPTDMGVFEISNEPLALNEVPHIENPQAFAISLENEGGNPVPTQVIMIQNI